MLSPDGAHCKHEIESPSGSVLTSLYYNKLLLEYHSIVVILFSIKNES